MPSTLASAEKGHRFPSAAFTLSSEWVSGYVRAVEDGAIANVGPWVPPMALAALSVRALLEQAPLPPGAIHVGQELSFQRAVSVGEGLNVRAEVASRGERQGWVLMGVSLVVEDANSANVMDGRATITFPLDPGAAAAA